MTVADNGAARLLAEGMFGWYFSDARPVDYRLERRQLENALNLSVTGAFERSGNAACFSTGGLQRKEQGPLCCIVGNPVWLDSELAATSREQDHATALSRAYTSHGLKFLKRLSGTFAFALFDPDKSLCAAGVDRLGRLPIYYSSIKQQGVVFATSAAAVAAHSAVNANIRSQSVLDYIYFHMIPSPVSVYEDVERLQPAQYLLYRSGKLEIVNYWLPDFQREEKADFKEMGEELKGLLKASVNRSAERNPASFGTFLSGGLDSSTVSGMAAEVSDDPVDAYTIGFSAEGYDEIPYARITAKHFGNQLHEYYVTPEDVVEALPFVAASYDEPFGNSSALPAYFCAKFAREQGKALLLAGDGGDELFAGNSRYAKQLLFESYFSLPSWLRKSMLESVLRKLPRNLPVLYKLHRYIEQANIPLPDRLQTYNFLHLHKPNEIFADDFLSQVSADEPIRLQREIYSAPAQGSTLDRMLYFDWQITLADNDLRKVSHMCAVAGIGVEYPMLSDELVAFSCCVPDSWKLQRGRLRHFFKESLRDWLPDETLKKHKQGFGLPFGVWMRSHEPLQEMAYDNLLKLKQRNYFRPEFIDRAIKLHREGHAAYYGELVWILTVLQLWLEARQLERAGKGG